MSEPSPAAESQAKPPQTWTYTPRPAGHIPIRKRTLFPVISGENLLVRAAGVLWPWSQLEYPGITRLRAWLASVPLGTAAVYARIPLPRSRALVVAAKLEAKSAELLALASELRAYAGAAKPKGFSKGPVFDAVPPPSE